MIQVGVRLPTLLSQGASGDDVGGLAERAEELGFDSVWCVDHLLAAQYVFGSASFEPAVLLAYLAGRTSRIHLGISVLIAPLRHQFWLLKQLGTLSQLAGERILLGLGAGWDEREFRVSDVDRSSRMRRLDIVLEALLSARMDGHVSFAGEAVQPAPARFRAILVGGGSSSTVLEHGVPVTLAVPVARRISLADGWVVRSSATPSMMAADLAVIRDTRQRLGQPSEMEVARALFLHVSAVADDKVALAEQMSAMASIGWRGTPDSFQATYPSGSISSIVERLLIEADLGVTHFILHPVGDVEQQMHQLASHVLPALRTRAGRAASRGQA